MAVGVGVAVASTGKADSARADTAGTSWVEDSVLTSSSTISSSDKYVLKSPSGYYYTGSISSKWGVTSTSLSSAAILTLSGSQSGFTIYNTVTSKYLTYTASNFTEGATGVSVTISSATITGSWAGTYNGLVNGSTGCLKCNTGSSHKFRWYSGTSYSSTMIPLELMKLKANKTLSSISVSGYTTSFTAGDTFSFGGTVTATYSDSTSANVTSSATFSGYNMNTAGNYTVTASYTEGGVTKTATYAITVAAATSPTLSFDITSFSGYTGQSISVTATYANLESDLAWSASGTGSISGGNITWSSSDHRNGTSTYTATLSGEGGKTIVADADGVDAAQCGITITQTTVDITKASTSIAQGRSETLAASHNASSVGGLSWTSSNDSVAAVDSSGKVTVAAGATVGATVTITATSSVDTDVSDTCTVTVAEAPLDTTYDFTENFSTYASSWSGYGSKTLAGTTDIGGDYAATITLPYASKQTGTITTMPVVADQASGDVIHISFELTASGYTLGDVSVTFAQWNAKAPTMKLFKGTTASGTELDSGVVGTKNTISASNVGGTTFVVAMNDNSTSRNQVGVQSIYISLVRENALDHVTVSFASDPADRTFYAGSNFAFNGTLTASYTADSPKTVTPTGYFLEGEEGTGDEITTSTILTVADYNGGEVYVQYEEGGVTKYDSFTLIVNVAPATSVTLSANTGSVALEEVFEVSSITATVNPKAYATQGVTWEVYDSDGLVEDSTYMFDGAEFYATEPADVVFHVKANSNGSIYATFTLTITGDPIAHLLDGELVDVTDGSTTVFGDAGTLTFGVTTENFEGTMSYGWSSNNSSIISIDDDQGDTCDFYVEGVSGSARLSCHVQGSTKGDVTVYIDVTVTAVTVTSVTWTAPTIDVFSGATLSSTAGWNVKYSTNSGKTDQTPESFNVKLGGTTISLPHTWVAADDGKTLCVEVGGTSSSTTTVAVTQSINTVNASLTSAWDYTFPSKQWSAAGDWTLDEKLWNMSGTDDGSPYFGWDNTKGQQFGSGSHPFSDVSLQSSAFSGTIDSVTVYTSGASSINATVQVSVGGTAYGSAQTITSTNTPYTFNLGGESGTISIDWVNSSSKAIYVKEIVVNTVTSESNIANVAEHKAAQRAAVAFANAFNAAMDETENCTEGLDDAWSTCSSAYTSFKSAAAALGSTEEAYAKNLVKYATAQYSDDSGEACIERMMKTYEVCVQKHGQTAFMSDLVTLGRAPSVNPVLANLSGANNTTITIAIVISLVSVTAIGGYFFLRKRKENI